MSTSRDPCLRQARNIFSARYRDEKVRDMPESDCCIVSRSFQNSIKTKMSLLRTCHRLSPNHPKTFLWHPRFRVHVRNLLWEAGDNSESSRWHLSLGSQLKGIWALNNISHNFAQNCSLIYRQTAMYAAMLLLCFRGHRHHIFDEWLWSNVSMHF